MGKAQRRKKRQRTEPRIERPPRPRLGLEFYVLCLLLVAITLAAYWQVNTFPLINCDDRDYITNNPIVKAGLTKEGLRWAFNVGYAGNWHPLTWLSHMLDSQLFGPGAPEGPGPGARHTVNLVLHVLNTILLLVVLTRMTGRVWPSAFVAAMFALHPQHVESVAWVAERKDVLSTLFMLVAMWAYSWYADRPCVLRYVLVAVAMAIGLMAKPMLVTLPIMLLILDYWPLRRFTEGWTWKLVWEKAPLFALAVGSSILTVNAQKAAGAVRSLTDLPAGQRVINALMSYAVYITKTIWPSQLGNYYTHPIGGWPAIEVAAAALMLVAITYLCIRAARSRPYLITGWFWYVISLVPVIGLVQVGSQARADRYTYVPIIGLFAMVAFLIPDLLKRLQIPAKARNGAAAAAAIVVIAGAGYATRIQVGYWKDGISVARRAIAVTQDNWFEEQSLGSLLQDEAERLVNVGQEAAGVEKAREAAAWLRQSIAHEETCADAHNDLGRALAVLKDYDGAIREYQRTLELYPQHRLAPNNLGNTYLVQGRIDEAIEQYQRVLEIDPTNIFATYNMGIAFQQRGDVEPAVRQYMRILELQPNDYFAHWARYNAAILLRRNGDIAESTRLLQEAVEVNKATGVDPNNAAAKALSNQGK